jgi:hypothetical protein
MTVDFVLSIISISGRHKQDVISVVELQHNLSKGVGAFVVMIV